MLILSDMMPIRGTSLSGFLELSRELGTDPRPLLKAARIPASAIGSQDEFLDHRRVIAVLEHAAAATGAPDFGRQLALRQGVEILGPVGVAARTAPTVGAAFTAVGQYMSVYSPALMIVIQPVTARTSQFVWQLRSERPQTHRQAAELGLGVSLGIFRVLAGEEFKPLEVHLRHGPLVAVEEYEEYFGAPMSFSADDYGFRFSSEVLQRGLASDAAVHDVVREYLSSVVTPLDDETDDAVRLLVRRMLPTGGLALELVASHLAVHPRTLQRQLAQAGSTFADIVDEVRREEAQRYLTDTRMPLGQIAGLLGYSEQSVLSRSCQRWFGRSPSRVRADVAS